MDLQVSLNVRYSSRLSFQTQTMVAVIFDTLVDGTVQNTPNNICAFEFPILSHIPRDIKEKFSFYIR